MPITDLSLIGRLIFIAITVAAVLAFLQSITGRVKIILSGRKEDAFDRIGLRIWRTIRYAFGQYRMPQEFSAGLLHIFIFIGFLVVSLRTLTLFGVGFTGSTAFHLPGLAESDLIGRLYTFLKDIVAGLVMIGCLGFAWRRLVSPSARMKGLHHAEPVLILGVIFLLMLTDIFLDGAQRSLAGEAAMWPAPLAALASSLIAPASAGTVYYVNWWLHCLLILGFLNYLPYGKHFHILTSFPNIFFSRLTPAGRLEPIVDMEATMEKALEGEGVLGAARVEDLSWKALLDVYTCTECGRCVPRCPANATGKPLAVRTLNIDIRRHLEEKNRPDVKGKSGAAHNGHAAEQEKETPPAFNGGVVTEETIWSCTLCRDCEERCPVLIENVPRMVEMRRYLTLMESRFPTELTRVFNGLERQSNPWGIARSDRGQWLQGTEVKRLSDDPEVEYLFFVGCMGSYDDRSIRTSKALAAILKAAGVRFGVLAEEENCNGETARRLGNEYLAQMLISANVETLNGYGIRKIVTNCPHCFNTLKNEYPDFGGRYQVQHATQLIAELIRCHKLPKPRQDGPFSVAWHDPCFLGRYNDVFDAPRELLQTAGIRIAEPQLSRRQSFCCGAGGGRMWIEEMEPRVNTARFDQIYQECQGASTIGVACPYCMTMLGDAAKGRGKEESVQVKDVVELMADRLGLTY